MRSEIVTNVVSFGVANIVLLGNNLFSICLPIQDKEKIGGGVKAMRNKKLNVGTGELCLKICVKDERSISDFSRTAIYGSLRIQLGFSRWARPSNGCNKILADICFRE